MLSLFIILSVLILLALVFVLPVLIKPSRLNDVDHSQKNIAIAKERVAELKQDFEAGNISEQEYQIARDELENTLAMELEQSERLTRSVHSGSGKTMAAVIAVALPVMAILIYLQLGHYDLPQAGQPQAASHQGAEGKAQTKLTMEEAIAKLEQKLQQAPDDPRGWYMLARTYMVLGRYQESATAFKKALDLVGDDPDLLVRYADAVAMTEGGQLNGKAYALIERALQLNPQQPQGLWMMGMAKFQKQDFKQALHYWYQLEPLLAQDAQSLSELHSLISQAESRIDPAALAAVKQDRKAVQAAAPASASIDVSVAIDDKLKAKLDKSDTVFIYARAMQGPPMPLAVARMTVADLPVKVNLNDSMAMMPSMKLSNFSQVKITALVSKSGMAKMSPGDYYGEVSPVSTQKPTSIKLDISQIK